MGSVDLIRKGKERGISVTAEATPHHLTLTDEVVGNYDTNTKVSPPLREPHDVEALWDAVADGTIDALARIMLLMPRRRKSWSMIRQNLAWWDWKLPFLCIIMGYWTRNAL